MPIPAVIYQTWKTKELHPAIQRVQQEILELNPEYQYQLFDDREMREFVQQEFDERIYRAFCQLRVGAARADFWRYLILYRRGGVYLDMDSVIRRPLCELIYPSDRALISREGNPGVFLQWLLIFEAGHPLLKRCIHLCILNIENRKTEDVFSLTGPGVFTQAIVDSLYDDLGYVNAAQLYEKSDDELCNLSMRFYGVDYEDFADFKHEYTSYLYAGHTYWRDDVNTSVFILDLERKPIVYFSNLGLQGRLGNVLFQYAAMKSVATQLNGCVVFPTGISHREHHGQKCLLTTCFEVSDGIEASVVSGFSAVYVKEECDGGFYDAGFMRRVCCGAGFGNWIAGDENMRAVNDIHDVNIFGQFESEKYFECIRDRIQQDLRLKAAYREYARSFFDDLRARFPGHAMVGLHIRRGDDATINQSYHTTYEYNHVFLGKAMQRLSAELAGPFCFIVFSGGSREPGNENGEDIEWCKHFIHGENVVYSEGNDTIHDFALMVHCDHLILNSSSSIGWWAGYLNYGAKNKKVIVGKTLTKSEKTYWPNTFIVLP